MPMTEAYYLAKGWLMSQDERRLFMHLIGAAQIGNRISGDIYRLDVMPISDSTTPWYYATVEWDGAIMLWVTYNKPKGWKAQENAGRWRPVHETDFAERFHATDLQVSHAGSRNAVPGQDVGDE